MVTAAARQRYQLRLTRRTPGLRSTWQIGFGSSYGQICGGFDDLIVDDGLGPERIRIASVRRLSQEDYEALLIRYGKLEPDIEQTPTPVEIDGAEVEELD